MPLKTVAFGPRRSFLGSNLANPPNWGHDSWQNYRVRSVVRIPYNLRCRVECCVQLCAPIPVPFFALLVHCSPHKYRVQYDLHVFVTMSTGTQYSAGVRSTTVVVE